MAIFRIDAPEGEVKALFDDLEKQEHCMGSVQMCIMAKLKYLTVTEKGMECNVDLETLEQCRKEFNVAMDQIRKDYERLRELGVVTIIKAKGNL